MGPTNREISIIMKLRDEMTKRIETVQGHIVNFSRTVQSAGKHMEDMGRHISKAGQQMAFLGTAIAGPLAVAFKNSAKYSSEVKDEIDRLSLITADFQIQLATAMIPVVQKLGNILQKLSGLFGSLSQDTKNMIVQGALMTGLFFASAAVLGIVSGKVLFLAGSFIKLAGSISLMTAAQIKAIAVNLAIAGAIVAIIYAMFKWKDVADVVMSTFQIMFNFLANGFDTALIGVNKFVEGAMIGITKVLEGLSKIPGPQKEAFISMAAGTKSAAESARKLSDEALSRIIQRADEIKNIFKTGEGTWAIGFQNMKEKMIEVAGMFDHLKDASSELEKREATRMKKMEEDTLRFMELAVRVNDVEMAMFESKLQGSSALLQEFQNIQSKAFSDISLLLAQLLGNLHSGLSDALSGIILGTQKASEAFRAMGQTMIKAIVDFLTQKAVALAIEKTLGAAIATFTASIASGLASAWAPAAALASLATLGGNAGPAAAAIASTVALSQGLAMLSAKPMARGGDEIVRRPTLFLAGEAGPERAIFQPLGGPFKSAGGDGGTIINISGPFIMQPGSNIEELAVALDDRIRRRRRYYGQT